MPNYQKQFITYETFLAYQEVGIRYEGFIEGMGYTYYSDFAIAPQHMQILETSPYVPPGQNHYLLGTVQYIDSSREAIARSYNISPEDIMDRIATVNGDGTITINMGNGQYMTLPQNNSNINITINDNFEEATLVINAKNILTQEFRETRTKLVDLPVVFGNIGGINQNLRVITSKEGASNGGDEIKNLLNCSSSAGSAWSIFDNFGYNHTSYPTTKGIIKNFSDFSGRNMSRQALKYIGRSKLVKATDNLATGVMVFQAAYKYHNGDRSFINYMDGGIGIGSLVNTALLKFWSYGSASLGQFVAVYGAARLMYDFVAVPNMNQIQDNIMNNKNPLEGVYNPTTGMFERTYGW
jgi:hypothetical protein